ncbi:MAG: ATP-binding protein, partial [Rubrivivax sp.]
MLAIQVEEKGLELLFSRGPEVPDRVVGDPLRLRQVLTNLTNNARKFTEQGDIVVRTEVLEREEESVLLRFTVQDSGIGMNEEQMQRLFQPFTQADDSITRRFGGSGLGLAISRQLVELMGGRLSVSSQLG